MAPVDDGLQPPRVRLDRSKNAGEPRLVLRWRLREKAQERSRYFNDFLFVSLLRAATLAAVRSAGPVGLGDDEIGNKVQTALGFRPEITARARRRNRGGASGRLIFLKRERPRGAYSINI